jgi:hypothetical protein
MKQVYLIYEYARNGAATVRERCFGHAGGLSTVPYFKSRYSSSIAAILYVV